MTDKFRGLDDYVTVAERIAAFHDKYPEGSLQSEIVTMTDKLVVVKAFAFRSPDDQRPGIGFSSLEIPGKTTFTRGSELENAESSAWGRAIAALGFEVKRGIATSNEIANKREDPPMGERIKTPTSAEIERERERIGTITAAATASEDSVAEADYIRLMDIGRKAKEDHPANYLAFQDWLEREFGGWVNFTNRGGKRVEEGIAILTAPKLTAVKR